MIRLCIFLIMTQGAILSAHANLVVGDLRKLMTTDSCQATPSVSYQSTEVLGVTKKAGDILAQVIEIWTQADGKIFDSEHWIIQTIYDDGRSLMNMEGLINFCEKSPVKKASIEEVVVPAGTFPACKWTLSETEKSKAYIWYGPVPFGVLKIESQSTSCANTTELIDYRFAD